MLKPGHILIKDDPAAINMLYIQCVHDVINDRIALKEAQAETLAALQLQATQGNYHPDHHHKGFLV